MIAAMVSLVYLWATGRRPLVKYFSACVAAFLLLGPVNPLLFPIWARLVSVTLMYRAIFAVPVWILFGYFFAICAKDIIGDRMTKNRMLALQVLALTGALLPLGMYAGEKFGLTGNETYYGKDSQSQLNSLPHLYRTIQELDQKVVLTDIWTGAPIPTISNNYIVVHRPWTSGPEKNRWTDGMETMRSLTSSNAHQNLCKWEVDLVLLNRAELPLMESQFLASPWLLPDFYNATNGPLPTYLREVDVIDNVHILNFDKKTCSE